MKKVTKPLTYNGTRLPYPGNKIGQAFSTINKSWKKNFSWWRRKMHQNDHLAHTYQGVIDQYPHQGYSQRVPSSESEPESEWFLPHFPVVQPERNNYSPYYFHTSVKFNKKRLDTEALAEKKLQSNIFDILVRFRKELEVLVVDVSRMQHQLILLPEDRRFQRFLW